MVLSDFPAVLFTKKVNEMVLQHGHAFIASFIQERCCFLVELHTHAMIRIHQGSCTDMLQRRILIVFHHGNPIAEHVYLPMTSRPPQQMF